MLKRVVVRERERIVEISTLDFLRILEAERRAEITTLRDTGGAV